MEYLSFCILFSFMAASSARSDLQWKNIFVPRAKPKLSLVSIGGISNWWPEVKKQVKIANPAPTGQSLRIQKIIDRNGKIYVSEPELLESTELENVLKSVSTTVEAKSSEHDYLREHDEDMYWTPAEMVKLKHYLKEFATDVESDSESYSQTKNKYTRKNEVRMHTASEISKQLDTLKGLLDRLIEIVVKTDVSNTPYSNDDSKINQVEDNLQKYRDSINELENQKDDTSGGEMNILKEYFSNLVSDDHFQLRSGHKLKVRKQKKLQENDPIYSKELENLKQYLELPAPSAENDSLAPPKLEYELSELIS